MNELRSLKDKISKFREVEAGIWNFLNEDPVNHENILKSHGKLQTYITELYTEMTAVGKAHDLFSHMKTESGKNIAEMLRLLRLALLKQYEDLLKIQNTQDRHTIADILNGNKNGHNESETSQKIKTIERELMNVHVVKPSGIILPKPEDIENSKTSAMYFDDSLKRIKNKFGDKAKHLTPVQYFEIIRLAKDDLSSPYREIFENIFAGVGECLSMAVKLENGRLYVALDPENLVRKGNDYEFVGGSIKCSSLNDYPANGLKPGWNNSVSNFINIFGDGCEGIAISRTDCWFPVVSYSNDYFHLLATGDGGASRGVR